MIPLSSTVQKCKMRIAKCKMLACTAFSDEPLKSPKNSLPRESKIYHCILPSSSNTFQPGKRACAGAEAIGFDTKLL
jgi:hypothetical protein